MCFGAPPSPPKPPPLPPAAPPPPKPDAPVVAPAPLQAPDAQPQTRTKQSKREEQGTLSQGASSLKIPLSGTRGGLNL